MDKKSFKISLKAINIFNSNGKIIFITKKISNKDIINMMMFSVKKINRIKVNRYLNKIILTPYE